MEQSREKQADLLNAGNNGEDLGLFENFLRADHQDSCQKNAKSKQHSEAADKRGEFKKQFFCCS